MLSTLIFLKEDQVLPRMKVALFLAVEGTPALDKEGNPLCLQVLIGGSPPHKKFYCSIRRPLPGAAIGTSLETPFRPDTWFAPVEAFSPATAPPNTEYVAYRHGKLTKLNCGMATLFKKEDGGICHVCWADAPRGLQTWARNLVKYDGGPVQLPLEAVLVPLGEVGKAEPPPPWANVRQGRSLTG